jgi:heme oxygenase
LKFAKNALANMMSELYVFISEMKKKAVQYAKDQIRTTLVPKWEKDRGTLQEQLTLLEKTSTPDNLAERNTLTAKIKSLTASIIWVNNTFAPAEVSI